MIDNSNNGGRDGHGRFTPGNPGGPGRPRADLDHAQALRRAVTPEAVERLALKLLELAESGDVKAAGLLLKFLVVPPDKLLDAELESRLGELERAAGL